MSFIIPIKAYGQKRVRTDAQINQRRERPKRCRQALIPKKPRFEPRSEIIPGNHKVVFEKANLIEGKNADL